MGQAVRGKGKGPSGKGIGVGVPGSGAVNPSTLRFCNDLQKADPLGDPLEAVRNPSGSIGRMKD